MHPYYAQTGVPPPAASGYPPHPTAAAPYAHPAYYPPQAQAYPGYAAPYAAAPSYAVAPLPPAPAYYTGGSNVSIGVPTPPVASTPTLPSTTNQTTTDTTSTGNTTEQTNANAVAQVTNTPAVNAPSTTSVSTNSFTSAAVPEEDEEPVRNPLAIEMKLENQHFNIPEVIGANIVAHPYYRELASERHNDNTRRECTETSLPELLKIFLF